jgi:hypothetical protein
MHTAATVLLVLRQPTPTVMSLMGWSSESMAARYQHVTDALRSHVASQVGELIWTPAEDGGEGDILPVRRSSLAAVLVTADDCINSHRGVTNPSPDVLGAIAELRAALAADAPPGTSNETKTETTRKSQR